MVTPRKFYSSNRDLIFGAWIFLFIFINSTARRISTYLSTLVLPSICILEADVSESRRTREIPDGIGTSSQSMGFGVTHARSSESVFNETTSGKHIRLCYVIMFRYLHTPVAITSLLKVYFPGVRQLLAAKAAATAKAEPEPKPEFSGKLPSTTTNIPAVFSRVATLYPARK